MGLLLSLIAGLQFLNPQIPNQDSSIARDSTLAQMSKDSNRIEIEQKIRKEYSLDTLKSLNFGIFPDDTTLEVSGTYSPWCDSLMLNYYGIKRFCKKNYLNFDLNLARVMKHELNGHYCTDKMQEKLGLKSELENKYSRDLIEVYIGLLKISENKQEQDSSKILFHELVNKGSKNITNIILDKIVNEGIAMYYEDPSAKPVLTTWPRSVKSIKNCEEYDRNVYVVGWNLMYPIISDYGERGIEYVLKNMPKYDDFSDLKAYQKKTLEKLAKQRE